MLTYYEVRQLCRSIVSMCDGIQLRSGVFLKEGIYQTLLIHELNKKGIDTTREAVFGMTFKDSEGKVVKIGDNHSLRTDIELPEHKGILELKASNNSTKQENIWQLRNYLEQRRDMKWGMVINFISKFGPRTRPTVQCDIVYPFNKEIIAREIKAARVRLEKGEIDEIPSGCITKSKPVKLRGVEFTRIWTETLNSQGFPLEKDLVFRYDKASLDLDKVVTTDPLKTLTIGATKKFIIRKKKKKLTLAKTPS